MTFTTNYLFAVPPLPPPTPYQPWMRARMQWIGWDGSVWDITDWHSGVILTQGGIEGLSRPSHTDWTTPLSPALHGQEFTGYVVDPRKVFWPLYLYADAGSDDFQQRDTAFWHTMRPDRPGTWRYTSSAGTRELRCRFQDDGGQAYERDPHFFGWARYGISLIADDPFWTGDPITKSWDQPEQRNFFGGLEKAPDFYIGSGSQLGSAKITNPGDVEAWPEWTITGPAENARLGVDDRYVSAPFNIQEGSTLTINSDPTDQTAWLDGEDVTHLLGDYAFASIPAGKDRPLQLSMEGTGAVSATITPRYDRAW